MSKSKRTKRKTLKYFFLRGDDNIYWQTEISFIGLLFVNKRHVVLM